MQPFDDVIREIERRRDWLVKSGVSPTDPPWQRLLDDELWLVQSRAAEFKKFLTDMRAAGGTAKMAERMNKPMRTIRWLKVKSLAAITWVKLHYPKIGNEST